MSSVLMYYFLSVFFFNVPAPTEIYTLSLHDALPISWSPAVIAGARPLRTRRARRVRSRRSRARRPPRSRSRHPRPSRPPRSEEHTSELQSHVNLVCRLLLEKKKKNNKLYNNRQKQPC